MTLTIKELREITNQLYDYLEETGCTQITFSPQDAFYQKIWHDKRDWEKIPEITTGDLYEDMKALKKIIDKKNQSHHLN